MKLLNNIQHKFKITLVAISSVEREVKTVGASAAALAALKPIEYHEGQKAQIMAAVGTYKGKTATALGVAHYAKS